MHPLLESAARRRGGVFTVADARRAGYRPDEIRAAVGSGAWHRLRRGIYVPAPAWAAATGDPRARHLLAAVAALTALGPGPVLSHSSAARFHELVLPRGLDDVVRLTDPDQWRVGDGYRIAAAALPQGDVVDTGPFRVTGVARTLVDCARELPLADAVVAIDAAISRKRVRRAELTAVVLEQSHWFGIGGAARALGLADGRAESPLETRGRLALLDAGLPRPELQVDLHGPRGFVARVDAWYEEAGVAVEFDGRIKYEDPHGGRTPAEVAWKEKRREDRIRDLDVRVVRVVDDDLPRLHGPAARLRHLLARPLEGPRRFRALRRLEPGSDPADAVA
ncbi:type IV toxin-antitoxin system AbiEi family antitoxin domain-containing protein [Blastococcus sp. SYSU DS1024]